MFKSFSGQKQCDAHIGPNLNTFLVIMFLCRTQCSVHFFEQSCMFIYRVQFSSYAPSILIDFEVFDPVVHPVFDHLPRAVI